MDFVRFYLMNGMVDDNTFYMTYAICIDLSLIRAA